MPKCCRHSPDSSASTGTVVVSRDNARSSSTASEETMTSACTRLAPKPARSSSKPRTTSAVTADPAGPAKLSTTGTLPTKRSKPRQSPVLAASGERLNDCGAVATRRRCPLLAAFNPQWRPAPALALVKGWQPATGVTVRHEDRIMTRAVVTGATGNVGSSLVELLTADGTDVVGVARRIPPESRADVQWVGADVAETDLESLFRGRTRSCTWRG